MTFCVYSQTIIFYMVFVTVTGNKCDKLSPGSLVDYPYIIYDTTDDWKSALYKLVTKLNTNDDEINRIVRQEHGERCDNINIDTAKLLRRMIIQHCVSLDIINSFGKEEKSLMKDAIKKGMETCKARIKSSDSDFNTDESEAAEHQCRFVAAVEHILLEKQKKARLSRAVNYMIENFKYASRNFEMEYMFLSLSDLRIANFLMKLFLEIDKLSPQNRHSIILSITNTEFLFRPEGTSYESTRDGIDLLTHSFNTLAPFKDYKEVPRNREQVWFQNELIKRHCEQKKVFAELSEEAKEVFILARHLKLKDFETRSKIFQYDVFIYKVISDCDNVMPKLLADIERDLTFLEIRMSAKGNYKALGGKDLNKINILLSMWIEEKIFMSVVDWGVYNDLKQIFFQIDNNPSVDVDAILNARG